MRRQSRLPGSPICLFSFTAMVDTLVPLSNKRGETLAPFTPGAALGAWTPPVAGAGMVVSASPVAGAGAPSVWSGSLTLVAGGALVVSAPPVAGAGASTVWSGSSPRVAGAASAWVVSPLLARSKSSEGSAGCCFFHNLSFISFFFRPLHKPLGRFLHPLHEIPHMLPCNVSLCGSTACFEIEGFHSCGNDAEFRVHRRRN